MRTHFSVKIEDEMRRIRDNGNTVLDCGIEQAWRELVQALREGKTYYSGCDSLKEDGKCAGHIE